MDADELRERFYNFTGAEQFRKFALELRSRSPEEAKFALRPRHSRLAYWQEKLWANFAATVNDVPDDLSQIRDALLWCDIHHRYLQKKSSDEGITSNEFAEVFNRHFPFGFGYWTLVCPDCVDACRAWMQADAPNHNQN